MAPSSPCSFRLGLLSAKHSRPGRRRASTWSRSLSAPATSSGPSPCHLLCAPRGPQNALSKNNSGVFFPKDPAVPPGEKEPASAGYPRPSPPGEPCTAPWGQPHLLAGRCPGASLPRLSRRAPPHLALSATPPPPWHYHTCLTSWPDGEDKAVSSTSAFLAPSTGPGARRVGLGG